MNVQRKQSVRKVSPEKRPGSLRERKAARTRHAIVSIASKLFLHQGFEATTLEQIAELADIHKQTVLRYFNSKEEIALDHRYQWYKRFEEALKDPARNVDVLTRWREIIDEVSHDLASREDLLKYYELIQSSAKLIAHSLLVDAKYETMLYQALVEEAGTDADQDFDAKLLSSFLIHTHRAIMGMVLKRGSIAELPELSLYVVDFAIQNFPRPRARRRSRRR